MADDELPIPQELLDAPGYVARRLYQAYLAAWVRMVDASITGPQFAVLVAVNDYPGEDQRSLGHVAALDRSTMADVVRRLEVRGLITRETAENDARRKLLYLTEEGREQLAGVNRRARDLDKKLVQGNDVTVTEQWLAELNALAEHWESLVED
ncbi:MULTISPECIES: MarR family winged helix-turn-helix transcriptional regulator [Prauserella salsuginis group]|uniref:DNA-binding MarR family transcriptional regulator n=2 Tax=Prauserella salsuginis group TaxID=2893672 RepID=A0A839XMJ7_9PSEU|nr:MULTISPECIES: MarR family winged helix-turn-helix transcriptional regulator [Prauserella salsuginis group]MBB3663961.1 DNA-binding MarR family transcriptional regulator [Prauserella sediminis]MCR3721417.1 DNA-binding transcriptional regulator, MarR family [Prauserella flava]MCR3732407.1 DNA-binding transcriptional regulator, MarR family [Prauserella salsuginis]